MPRSHNKKRIFHRNQFTGTPYNKTNLNPSSACQTSISTSTNSGPPNLTTNNIEPQPCPPISASRRKLSYLHDTSSDDNNNNIDIHVPKGNLIIDMDLLSSFIKTAVSCKNCKSDRCIDLVEDVSKRRGLATKLSLVCDKCSYSEESMTSKISRQRLYEVNVRYTYGLRSIGKGRRPGEMLAAVMDLPKPVSRQTRYTTIIGNYVQEVSEASMRNAVEEAVEENPIVDKPGRLKSDVPIALDGSWHKRGHLSLNGVITATSVDGGKVVDLECLTKHCACKKDKKGKKLHVVSCAANFEGNSGGMEAEGAVRIFNRSVSTRGVRYRDYLGDGDSKGFKKVVESNPYGDKFIVEKLECVGHIQKRMGTKLLKVVKDHTGRKLSDGKRIGGKGRLTKEVINELQDYYGNAIRNNENNLPQMKKDVWATYFHKLSTDANFHHELCPADGWCKFNKGLKYGKPYTHKHSLPEPICAAIKPVYKDLASEDLLKKCLHGKTQNCNESFNSLIWLRLPKTVFVGINTLKLGAYDAALCWNDGNIGKIRVLDHMGIKSGNNTKDGLRAIDELRIVEADKAALASTKTHRQMIRKQNKRKEDDEEDDEDDPSYGAGMH